ncbi:MAG: flagellar biosynthesis protein FlhB [Mariprofundaceae bacterium]|nr:flagellar biosynthesis protein FlhB [Mariprofundaceae bacterium]
MADDQDKSQQTEDASQKRIDDARQKGQVPTSKEPATAIAFLLISSLAVTGLGAWLASHMMNMMVVYLSGTVQLDTTPKGMQHLLASVAWDLAMMILPVAIPVMLVGMLVAFLVSGPVFTFETLKPKAEKVSPMKGFKRLFSTKSLAEFIKSILKLVIISSVCWVVLNNMLEITMMSSRKSVDDIAALLVSGSLKIAAVVAALFFVIALADVLYQRWEHTKSLKMSMKEVRDEHKESEGDPQLKGKIRQIQMEQSRNRMMQDVPKADVVITNPTHIAIALKYDELNPNAAPKVVAVGKDKVAEQIRRIARENDVPIRENKPLARSLFKVVKVGDEIPEEMFEAVAIILAEIYQART